MLAPHAFSTFDEMEDWGTVARLVAPNGTPFTIVDVSKWQVSVFDYTDPSNPIAALRPLYTLKNVVPTSNNLNQAKPSTPQVISSTLRTDGYWTKGGAGYNFLHFICKADTNVLTNDGTLKHVPPFRPRGGRAYVAEYMFQTTSGIFTLQNLIQVRPVLTVGML